ncbi:MAG: monovalent cation/H+ antiporter complex subunit F [Anaerolineae bacterium]|nr:monovalent cation/H+ antiporter complex subunit F [Anaerolineae bacterium]
MNPILFTVLSMALIFLILLLIPCAWRVIKGPSVADRVQAIDTITNVFMGIVVLLALTRSSPLLISVAIALAAFSFVGTLALARYVGSGRIF